LQALGILARLHPALHFDDAMAQAFVALRAARTEAADTHPLRTEPIDRLYWGILVAQLPMSAHAALAERLGLRGETRRLMAGLAKLQRHRKELESAGLAPSRVVALFDAVDDVALALLPVLYAGHAQLLDYATRYQTSWRGVHPELDGHDLAALGIPRGPLYADLLRTLRAARLDGVLLTRGDEEAYIRSYLQRP
jgi:tRNA nucleotidyltransferase (CCA-adding enzyme)